MAKPTRQVYQFGGGLVTDGNATERPVEYMENFLPRKGGQPGLLPREGMELITQIASDETEGSRVFLVTEVPGIDDALIVVYNCADQEITFVDKYVDQSGRSNPGVVPLPPGSHLVPVAMVPTLYNEEGTSNDLLGMIAYDTEANDFVNFYRTTPYINNALSGHNLNSGAFVTFSFDDSDGVASLFDWVTIRQTLGSYANVDPPPPQFDGDFQYYEPEQTASVPSDGPDTFYGWGWVSSGGVFYQVAETSSTGLNLARFNTNTGALIGVHTITAPVISGSTSVTFYKAAFSRPDANGDVLLLYKTNNSKHGLAKINPATGAISASLDMTATAPVSASEACIIPLSTGQYCLWWCDGTHTRLFRIAANLSTITEILTGTLSSVYTLPLPLLGGESDTIYMLKYQGPGFDDFRLHTVSGISTSPAQSTSGTTLPSTTVDYHPSDVFYKVYTSHFRLNSTTMMYGRWAKVTLATGAVAQTLPRVERYGAQLYDTVTLGGSNYLVVGRAECFQDPMRYLMALEGARETV